MNLHEYQARQLFTEYGLSAPAGMPARTVREAMRHAASLGGNSWVIKAQVHAGGRGKAGGVKLVKGQEQLEQAVRELLGSRLVTRQSAPRGQPVHCVLVQAVANIASELYLGMLVGRERRRVAVMASRAGGMDIEEVAARAPEQIYSIHIDPVVGIRDYQCRQLGFSLGLDGSQRSQLGAILTALYRLFIDKDLSLVEINPLIITDTGQLEALDAKISLDDNALFRQVELAEWRDITQEDEKESSAKQYDLNYVTLGGDIGCMVNGAGLAMATMDTIKLHGGEPANFLDVGGGATAERVAEAFRLITSEQRVKAVLINIFGGIVRCDLIAKGIIKAVAGVGVSAPVVTRLEGTNAEQGRQLLADSKLNITTASDLADAADKAVKASRAT